MQGGRAGTDPGRPGRGHIPRRHPKRHRPTTDPLKETALIPGDVFPAEGTGDDQAELNQCADLTCQQADPEPNALWQKGKKKSDGLGAGDTRLDAQRRWIAFRDAGCRAQAAPLPGGSIRPLVFAPCDLHHQPRQ
ncbi:MAG TPA: hypothetical protein DIU07_00430 [Rhodobacteraceae bacterium]|nr:hypothetical protein [Paracoccaceae bacterium]